MAFADVVVAAFARIDEGTTRIIGVREVVRDLGLAVDEGVYQIVDDLATLGIVGLDSYEWVKPTSNTDKIKHAGRTLSDIWPSIFERYLTPDQALFLAALVELAHRPGERTAHVETVHIREVYESLNWSTMEKDPYRLTEALEDVGFVEASKATGE